MNFLVAMAMWNGIEYLSDDKIRECHVLSGLYQRVVLLFE